MEELDARRQKRRAWGMRMKERVRCTSKERRKGAAGRPQVHKSQDLRVSVQTDVERCVLSLRIGQGNHLCMSLHNPR